MPPCLRLDWKGSKRRLPRMSTEDSPCRHIQEVRRAPVSCGGTALNLDLHFRPRVSCFNCPPVAHPPCGRPSHRNTGCRPPAAPPGCRNPGSAPGCPFLAPPPLSVPHAKIGCQLQHGISGGQHSSRGRTATVTSKCCVGHEPGCPQLGEGKSGGFKQQDSELRSQNRKRRSPSQSEQCAEGLAARSAAAQGTFSQRHKASERRAKSLHTQQAADWSLAAKNAVCLTTSWTLRS